MRLVVMLPKYILSLLTLGVVVICYQVLELVGIINNMYHCILLCTSEVRSDILNIECSYCFCLCAFSPLVGCKHQIDVAATPISIPQLSMTIVEHLTTSLCPVHTQTHKPTLTHKPTRTDSSFIHR